MEKQQGQDQSFELRSEKVRSVVGQMPPSILRYGIAVIGVALLCLLVVAYFLPYKQVYRGTLTVRSTQAEGMVDSVDIAVLLKFENRPLGPVSGQQLYLQSSVGCFAGQLLQLSAERDTLERQAALCRFRTIEIRALENQTVDFQLVHTSGNLLQKMLGGGM